MPFASAAAARTAMASPRQTPQIHRSPEDPWVSSAGICGALPSERNTMRLTTLLLLLPLMACASRGPAIQQMEADSLYSYGAQKLAEQDWNDAAEAFERFTLVYTNHPRIAEARYRLGEAYMGREEYVTAAMEFNRLASDFPTGPWADDARYQVCRSY